MEDDLFKILGKNPYSDKNSEYQSMEEEDDLFQIQQRLNGGNQHTSNDSFAEKILKQVANSIINSNLSKKLVHEAKDIGKNPVGFAENAILEGGKSAQGAMDAFVNFPSQIINIALPKEYRIPLLKRNEGTAYDIGKIGGDIGTYAVGGGALNAGRAVLESAPWVGKIAKSLGGEGLSGIGRRALGSAAYGAVENPDDKLQGALLGGALSGGTDIALKSLPIFAHPIRNFLSLFDGNLSPKILKNNLESAEGTLTNLGDVIGSPNLKKQYENILSRIPGGGVIGKMQSTVNQIKERGNQLLSEIIPEGSTDTLKQDIVSGLRSLYKSATKTKNDLWSQVNDLSDKFNVGVQTNNLSKIANSILEETKKSPLLSREMPQNIKEDLQFYANHKPEKLETIRDLNILQGKYFRDSIEKSSRAGEKNSSNIYSKLKKAADQDIADAIEKSGIQELKNKFQVARQFQREHLVPFEKQPEIKKYIKGENADSSLILSTFLKTGRNDRVELADRLLRKLRTTAASIPKIRKDNALEELIEGSLGSKGLDTKLSYAFLADAIKDGELNPMKMRSLYNSLGPKQQKLLFGEKIKSSLDKYSKLVEMNTEPLTNMHNLKTGMRLLDLIPHSLFGYAGYKLDENDFLGGLGGLALASLATRGASRALTSPKVRKDVVQHLINKQTKQKIKSQEGDLARALSQALGAHYISRKNQDVNQQ